VAIKTEDTGINTIPSIHLDLAIHVPWNSILFSAFLIGSVAFLNTWDTLVFVILMGSVYLAGIILEAKRNLKEGALDTLLFLLLISLGGILLFLPFYIGFSSQAGGVIPNLIYVTRGAHFWVMFAPLLIPASIFMLYKIIHLREKSSLQPFLNRALKCAFLVFTILFALTLTLGLLASQIPQVNTIFLGSLAASNIGDLFSEAVTRRMLHAGGWLSMFALFVGAFTLLLMQFSRNKESSDFKYTPDAEREKNNGTPILLFVMILFVLGLLLVIGPEFVFLRDQFGWRINTIFKFYYQAWLLWSIAAAYGSVVLFLSLRRKNLLIWSTVFVTLFTASLVYPVLSMPNKTNGFSPARWTLDSSEYLSKKDMGEFAAIQWIADQEPGVVAEAVSYTGGSYTEYARISTFSGKPAVLGWIGHENQWRGGAEEMSSRQPDIERMYCSRDWKIVESILNTYQIRYVVVGPLEKSTYQIEPTRCPTGLNQQVFDQNLRRAFESKSTVIYEYIP
jgi:uncharacterized membrane protein